MGHKKTLTFLVFLCLQIIIATAHQQVKRAVGPPPPPEAAVTVPPKATTPIPTKATTPIPTKPAAAIPTKPAAAKHKKPPAPVKNGKNTKQSKVLSCMSCLGDSFKNCQEKSFPCPPGEQNACGVTVTYDGKKLEIKKGCMITSVCQKQMKRMSKGLCRRGYVKKDKGCTFCCKGDNCNKEWPAPQLRNECTGFSSWGSCNATCGKGKQRRNHTCGHSVIAYNFWTHVYPYKKLRGKRSTITTFLPKLPAKVTAKETKYAYKECQAKHCPPSGGGNKTKPTSARVVKKNAAPVISFSITCLIFCTWIAHTMSI